MLAAVAMMVVLFLVSGGALAGALLMSRRRRLEGERRVQLVAAPPLSRMDRADVWLQANAKPADERVRRFFTFGAGPTWGMTSGIARLLLLTFGAAAITWVAAVSGLGLPLWLAAPIALAAAYGLPRLTLMRQQKGAEQEFTDLFPDAVISVSRMLRAGLPVTTAVRALATEAPPPVNGVFATMADQVALGTPIEEALDASSRHVGLADFRFFAVAVVLQHATGGNLAATLEILSDIVRKRRAMRLKARATTAEIRVSAYVLGSMPFMILGALLLIQPGYLAPLFVDPRGQVIVAIAAGGLLLAGITMRQMMRSVTAI
jgi:tight adherence protein B